MALISKTGISNGNTIQPEHLTRIIDALNESGSATIIATGSFTGSFKGDGSQITGVTGEWDGSLNGNASITGSLNVTAGITGSITGSFKGDGSQLNGLVSASYATSASYVSGGITDGTLTSRVIPFISSSRLFNSSIYQTANDEITIGSIGGSSAMLQVMQSNSGKDGLAVLYTTNDANQAAISALTLYTCDLLKLTSLTGSFVVKSNGKTIVTGSVEVSNGITGSFKGDGSGLTNLPSTTIFQSATGSVSASVGISTNSFTVVSGSTTLLNVKSNGGFSAGIGNTTQLLGDVAIGTFNLAGAKKVDFYNVGGVYYNASLKTMYVTGDVTTYAASGSSISWMHSNNYALYTSTVASTPSYNGTYTSIVITSDPSGGVNDTFLYDYGYLVTEKNTDAYPAGRLAHGAITTAWGRRSHAEGYYTQALGRSAHSEGQTTVANGVGSHAEGFNTYSNGQGSHAEGYLVSSSANYSHAEGQSTNSTGIGSHAEGLSTISAGSYSHAEGQSTVSVGTYSHAEGIGTVASGSGQTAAGKYNTHGNTTSLVVIGNGSSDSVRGDLALFNSQSIQFTVPLTGSIISGSFVGNGASITGVVSASYATTASHVNLVAGPNITINKTGDTFTISGSAGSTGSASNSITWVTFAGSSPNYNIYLSSSYGYINQSGDTHNGFLILPASASLGDTFQYVGATAGGGASTLTIDQTRTNEKIYVDGTSTTTGTAGYLQMLTTSKQSSYTFTCIQTGSTSTGHRWAITSFASVSSTALSDLTLG